MDLNHTIIPAVRIVMTRPSGDHSANMAAAGEIAREHLGLDTSALLNLCDVTLTRTGLAYTFTVAPKV